MTLEQYNTLCSSLAHTNCVIQWGNATVWKVDVKVFAMARADAEGFRVSFKTSDIGYEVLRDMPGLRPAPYLASRGMKWIQHFPQDETGPGLDDAQLAEHLITSHRLASRSLTKKRQKELGLNQD